MKSRLGFLTFIFLIFTISVQAADLSTGWFQSELTVDESPFCNDVLEQSKAVLNGERSQMYPPTLIEQDFQQNNPIQVSGKKIYLASYTHKGCGGSCSRYSLLASIEEFPSKHDDARFYYSLLEKSPPAASQFTFLSSHSGEYYVFVPGKESDQFYQLNDDATWTQLCSVSKNPTGTQIIDQGKDYSIMEESLSDLRGLVQGLRKGGGCGSSNTHHRWARRTDDEFKKLLYSPRLSQIKDKRYNDSTYEKDMEGLDTWSLMGLNEYNALALFKSTLIETTTELSVFYQKYFDWTE
ncbi:MAG: hypothetical protein ACI93R_001995 [Flavobacteriales bacterium]|jgi:hypothetical protein